MFLFPAKGWGELSLHKSHVKQTQRCLGTKTQLLPLTVKVPFKYMIAVDHVSADSHDAESQQ